MMLSVAVLIGVFILIASRRLGSLKLHIWVVMLSGGLAVLVTGQISPAAAVRAVNLDVILFLFGMFVIGEGLEASGYLAHLSHRLFRGARSLDGLVLLVLFGAGLLAAVLMNDTVAVIGTPIVLMLSRQTTVPARILLLSLAFAVTIGSVMSPIGNPQNLLIAVDSRVASPFITFGRFLLVPTMLNLLITYVLFRLVYRRYFAIRIIAQPETPLRDPRLARLSRLCLILLAGLILVKIGFALFQAEDNLRLTYIALTAMLPLLLFSPKRFDIIRNMDWPTLVFFAAMFVLMQSVWDSGIFQGLMRGLQLEMGSTSAIMGISVFLSQIISNVPLVALYLPVLVQLGASTQGMMALAAGSTIAGNLTILGAASNVIIIQNAERKSRETLTFFEFARMGLPLTALNAAVYWAFLSLA
ncbi:MAG: anion transporter [Chloroflexi bacterium]|nr:anion transporter [Chloroflexota bacterium]